MQIFVQIFYILAVFQATEFVNASSSSSSECYAFQKFQSCDDIKKHYPTSSSGYYELITYCDMGDDVCGSKEGGWTRVAYLDMSDSSQSCPSGFKLYQSGEVRACGRQTSSGPSCQSVTFQTGISYSKVCGRVFGYQYYTPDAVQDHQWENSAGGHDPNHNDINSHYVDGVSITHGYPRQHIWTFMGGLFEVTSDSMWNWCNCPCSTNSNQNSNLPSFIDNDYFCESGNPNSKFEPKLYTQDPLWDGKKCGPIEQICCSARPSLPWFHKDLDSATTDHIELRVCADQSTTDEDVPVSFYEIYVK